MSLTLLTVVLIITTPIYGVLARWRAHYDPTGVRLDSEKVHDVEEKKVSNVFQMAAKVYRIEGIEGLCKGFMLAIIKAVVSNIVMFVVNPEFFGHLAFSASHLHTTIVIVGRYLQIAAVSLVFLPLSVLYVRSVMTPYRLSWFNPVRSLRILMTPAEFSRPWTLYTTPGLIPVTIGAFLCKDVSRSLYVYHFLPWNAMSLMLHIPLIILHLMLIFAAFPALDVIRTKLSVRQDGIDISPPQVDPPAREYSSVEVVGFRREPYSGFVDCAKKIVHEEGAKTLFRLWWITLWDIFPIISVARSWIL